MNAQLSAKKNSKIPPSPYATWLETEGGPIIGGLVVSQLLTLYTTPIIYLYLDRLRHRGRFPSRRAPTQPQPPQPSPVPA